jgi:NAD(P)-dependent dehydrogenase (short-subunit alcohol dehydrogenase family)
MATIANLAGNLSGDHQGDQGNYRSALIVGVGEGLGASLARVFAGEGGMQIVMAARRPDKLQALSTALGAHALRCDATKATDVAALFEQAARLLNGGPEVVVYNASRRVGGAFVELAADAVAQAIELTAFGAFLVAQQAARRMVPRQRGAILFTGASASVKGYPKSAAFAMGKFAQRGLAQSLARELAPQGIHVGHIIIDGAIRRPGAAATVPSGVADAADSQLDPDAIARTYLHLLAQPRSAWTWEIEVRPWVERF